MLTKTITKCAAFWKWRQTHTYTIISEHNQWETVFLCTAIIGKIIQIVHGSIFNLLTIFYQLAFSCSFWWFDSSFFGTQLAHFFVIFCIDVIFLLECVYFNHHPISSIFHSFFFSFAHLAPFSTVIIIHIWTAYVTNLTQKRRNKKKTLYWTNQPRQKKSMW